MKKIESLTLEQIAKFPEYVEKWIKIGTCTRPADKEKAEDACRRAYIVAGLEPPKKIVWCDSPLSGAIVASIFKNDDLMKEIYSKLGASGGHKTEASVRASVAASVWDSVEASARASVWASVWDSVAASVRASVRDSVGVSVWASVWDSVEASARASVWASVRDSVGVSVWASVRASVWDSVRDSVGVSVWASVTDSFYGQHDSGWLSFYNYFLEQCNLEVCEKLKPLMDLAENCGWWIPYQNIAFLQEKQTICKLQNGVIHSEKGPAIAYKDGFQIHALYGIIVPSWIVEDKPCKEKFKKILAHENAEQRMVAIKFHGVANFIEQLGYESIEKDSVYDLIKIKIADEWCNFLKMKNPSTGEYHVEGVPNECRTIDEALAWRNGMEIDSFARPEVLT